MYAVHMDRLTCTNLMDSHPPQQPRSLDGSVHSDGKATASTESSAIVPKRPDPQHPTTQQPGEDADPATNAQVDIEWVAVDDGTGSQ